MFYVNIPLVPNEPDLLTPAEVAALLRVASATVRRWAADGRLPSVTLPGGQRRFRRSDVDALLEPLEATA